MTYHAGCRTGLVVSVSTLAEVGAAGAGRTFSVADFKRFSPKMGVSAVTNWV